MSEFANKSSSGNMIPKKGFVFNIYCLVLDNIQTNYGPVGFCQFIHIVVNHQVKGVGLHHIPSNYDYWKKPPYRRKQKKCAQITFFYNNFQNLGSILAWFWSLLSLVQYFDEIICWKTHIANQVVPKFTVTCQCIVKYPSYDAALRHCRWSGSPFVDFPFVQTFNQRGK